MSTNIDLRIESHGTVSILQPMTARAREWLAENVQAEPWQVDATGAVMCEPRMARDVGEGAALDGLEVLV